MSVGRSLVHAKIHRATVTGADLHYVGSITIDGELLERSGIVPFERVQVVDVTNGARLETYAISGARGTGVIQMNGAAAHLVSVGDVVIVMAYAQVQGTPPADWHPTVLLLNADNTVREVIDGRDHERSLAPGR